MKIKDNLVPISESVLDLYLCELNEAHRLLDKAGIPQDTYGERLSISQRVALLVERYDHVTH